MAICTHPVVSQPIFRVIMSLMFGAAAIFRPLISPHALMPIHP